MSAHKYYGIALEYARRGFAALIVMRRGYGTSPGGRVDSVGGCANAAYLPAAAVAVADLRAAIEAMVRRADVTTSGMIAAGHSAGGFATCRLDRAGASGSRRRDQLCRRARLARR
ncbi:alpha-beta hydrolase superfamily lysophospholipase [Bradyrhizobium sp. GM0.4]